MASFIFSSFFKRYTQKQPSRALKKIATSVTLEKTVRYTKFRRALVKMPLHNFQFRAGANLSYFIVDEKLLIFRLGKN